jgi:hypothetical protein
VTDALVFDVPVELCLELMTVIGSDLTNAERELFDDMVDEGDSASLGVALIDFEGSDAGGIVDGRVLITLDRFFVFALKSQELNINLDLMARHLLLVSLGVNFAQPGAARKSADAIALQNAVNTNTGYFDVVITGEIPHDADWPEMISLPQVQDLLNNSCRGLMGMRSCDRPSADEANLAILPKGIAP